MPSKSKVFKAQTVDIGIILPEFQLEPLSETDHLKVITHTDPVPYGHSFPCAPEVFSTMCPHRLHMTCRAILMQRLHHTKPWQDWTISHMENEFCWPPNITWGWMKRINTYHGIFGSLGLRKVVKSLMLAGFNQQVKYVLWKLIKLQSYFPCPMFSTSKQASMNGPNPISSAPPWCDGRIQAKTGGKIKLKRWQRGENRDEGLFSKNLNSKCTRLVYGSPSFWGKYCSGNITVSKKCIISTKHKTELGFLVSLQP